MPAAVGGLGFDPRDQVPHGQRAFAATGVLGSVEVAPVRRPEGEQNGSGTNGDGPGDHGHPFSAFSSELQSWHDGAWIQSISDGLARQKRLSQNESSRARICIAASEGVADHAAAA
ncbi:hypothetical protein [Saccharopolyspora hattusasensis]|uniref:hypothetical protein n=1 Tax=Saccharopolyspora hattusasensis TaxID=1128679 RepID=UPI003D96FB67